MRYQGSPVINCMFASEEPTGQKHGVVVQTPAPAGRSREIGSDSPPRPTGPMGWLPGSQSS